MIRQRAAKALKPGDVFSVSAATGKRITGLVLTVSEVVTTIEPTPSRLIRITYQANTNGDENADVRGFTLDADELIEVLA